MASPRFLIVIVLIVLRKVCVLLEMQSGPSPSGSELKSVRRSPRLYTQVSVFTIQTHTCIYASLRRCSPVVRETFVVLMLRIIRILGNWICLCHSNDLCIFHLSQFWLTVVKYFVSLIPEKSGNIKECRQSTSSQVSKTPLFIINIHILLWLSLTSTLALYIRALKSNKQRRAT